MNFRDGDRYNELREKLEAALQDVWPHWATDDECNRISTEPRHIERLLLVSFSLMKYIRTWLKSKKLNYVEGHTFPSFFGAIEHASSFLSTAQKDKGSLADESAILEAVSRACYNWMKTNKVLSPLRGAQYWCQCCKNKLATDTILCDECGKEETQSVRDRPFDDADFPLPGGDMMANFARRM